MAIGTRSFLVILLVVGLASSVLPWQQPTNLLRAVSLSSRTESVPFDLQLERQLLELANQARTGAGLAPLQSDEGLVRAAREHSALMASEDQLSHQFPGELALLKRLAGTSMLHLSAVAENVGFAPNVVEMEEGFMHSLHHRENLLSPTYNLAGFGVVRKGNMIYVTEDFGRGQPIQTMR